MSLENAKRKKVITEWNHRRFTTSSIILSRRLSRGPSTRNYRSTGTLSRPGAFRTSSNICRTRKILPRASSLAASTWTRRNRTPIWTTRRCRARSRGKRARLLQMPKAIPCIATNPSIQQMSISSLRPIWGKKDLIRFFFTGIFNGNRALSCEKNVGNYLMVEKVSVVSIASLSIVWKYFSSF